MKMSKAGECQRCQYLDECQRGQEIMRRNMRAIDEWYDSPAERRFQREKSMSYPDYVLEKRRQKREAEINRRVSAMKYSIYYRSEDD